MERGRENERGGVSPFFKLQRCKLARLREGKASSRGAKDEAPQRLSPLQIQLSMCLLFCALIDFTSRALCAYADAAPRIIEDPRHGKNHFLAGILSCALLSEQHRCVLYKCLINSSLFFCLLNRIFFCVWSNVSRYLFVISLVRFNNRQNNYRAICVDTGIDFAHRPKWRFYEKWARRSHCPVQRGKRNDKLYFKALTESCSDAQTGIYQIRKLCYGWQIVVPGVCRRYDLIRMSCAFEDALWSLRRLW